MEFSREALAAKISARRGYLLHKRHYREIDKLRARRELIAYLKGFPSYSGPLSVFSSTAGHRILEEQMATVIYYDFLAIIMYLPADLKVFLRRLFAKFEGNILKKVLHTCVDNKPKASFAHFERSALGLFSLDIMELMEITEKTPLFSFLRGTSYAFLALRMDDTPLSELENMLDVKYFTDLFAAIKKIENKIDRNVAHRVFGARVDLTNISWIWRIKENFGINPSNIRRYLIPVHAVLPERTVDELIFARDKDSFMKVLGTTIYGKYFSALSPIEFEEAIAAVPRAICAKLCFKHPHSIAPAVGLLLRREREIKRISTIIECKNYGIDTEALINSWEDDGVVNS